MCNLFLAATLTEQVLWLYCVCCRVRKGMVVCLLISEHWILCTFMVWIDASVGLDPAWSPPVGDHWGSVNIWSGWVELLDFFKLPVLCVCFFSLGQSRWVETMFLTSSHSIFVTLWLNCRCPLIGLDWAAEGWDEGAGKHWPPGTSITSITHLYFFIHAIIIWACLVWHSQLQLKEGMDICYF